jgi:[acyl-carrier-protein] S-malonyltransferase
VGFGIVEVLTFSRPILYVTTMRIAFVFPGQGSQAVGMLGELAGAYPEVRQTFADASVVLGYDLWSIVSAGPEERLGMTEVTQPAMLCAGVAVWRVWRAAAGPPAVTMAGHSLGEYTALVCVGTLDFAEAVSLVADRARYMQEAVPAGEGSIAAVLGLTENQIRAVCAEAAQGEVVEPVNFNSPTQIVIAGSTGAVARAIERAKASGAKRAVRLALSVPAHSSLMAPAASRLAERLKSVELRKPSVPVVHNATAKAASTPSEIREVLVRQIASPVRWVETIENMNKDGAEAFVECGPGKVLTGLNKRIARDSQCCAISDVQSLNAARVSVSTS